MGDKMSVGKTVLGSDENKYKNRLTRDQGGDDGNTSVESHVL